MLNFLIPFSSDYLMFSLLSNFQIDTPLPLVPILLVTNLLCYQLMRLPRTQNHEIFLWCNGSITNRLSLFVMFDLELEDDC